MRITILSIILLAASLIALPAVAQIHDPRALAADPDKAEGPIAPKLDGLGDYHFPVTTQSPDSQQFFDQHRRRFLGFVTSPVAISSCLQPSSLQQF